MPTFTNVIYARIAKPYYYYFIAIVVIIMFVVATIYGFKWFYGDKQKKKDFQDVANASHSAKPIEIFFFNVD